MSRLNLWLIRHGETEVNAGGWSVKPAETRLTLLGREQAQNTAAKITAQPDLLILSPLIRAKETAQFILNQWPNTPHCTWPIQELIYLSPKRLQGLSQLERKEQVTLYWQKNDPFYRDGDDAESFASFLQRVVYFHARIIKQQGFVIAIGHGQFFNAYRLGLSHGFAVSPAWMTLFRQKETADPMKNGEIFQMYFNPRKSS